MNEMYVRNVVEAALLAAGRPLTMDELLAVFDERDGPTAEVLLAAIAALRGEYENRGLELVEVASGFRIQIRASVAEPVSRLWQERPAKYSRAMLETLALIAYRQPITRGEIEDVRGVVVSTNILRTLQERGWVREVGHKEVPGRPALYGSAPQFLDDFNLKSLDQLPQLPEIKDLDQLEAALQRLGQGAGALAALGGPAQDAADGDADESTPAGAAQAQDEDGESGADASEHDQSAEDKPPSDAIFH
jgi:segregation and condensation protein B